MAGGGSLVARLRRVGALLPVLVRREIRTKYRTSALDLTWAIITPVALLAVYGIILTSSFDVTTACAPYLSSAWTGLVVWTTFATAVGGGVYSLVTSSSLITKIYFPLEAMPLAQVGVSFIDLFVGLAILGGLLVVQGVGISATALWMLLPLAVLVVWASVVAVASSTLAVFVPDAVHLVMLVLRVGFFATPVMYESSFLPSEFAWSARVNPIAIAIEGLRACLLCGDRPGLELLSAHLLVGMVLLAAFVLYTRSIESRVVDVV